MHGPSTPAIVSGGQVQYIPYLWACHRHQSPSLPFPPTHVNTHDHFILHIPSLSLNPLFIALVVIKCAMCTSIQVVCTPKPPCVPCKAARTACAHHPSAHAAHCHRAIRCPFPHLNITYLITWFISTPPFKSSLSPFQIYVVCALDVARHLWEHWQFVGFRSNLWLKLYLVLSFA